MTRACGECTLCCKLLPVRSLGKGAGERCEHQRHGKGCAVYAKLMRVSPECRMWNCRWLKDETTGDLRRPDRSHYVIDVMPEYITLTDATDGAEWKIPVVQIWVDPDYPDAHRDPALRAWLNQFEGWAGLVRYSGHEGFVLFPPNMCPDGEWHEQASNHPVEVTHTARDLVREFGWGALGL